MNIILIDDEPKIRNGLLKFLNTHFEGKHSFVAFGDSPLALEYLSKHPVDSIITDISMPELSGLELIQRIRETNQEVSIIILSGYSNFSYAQKAIELGVRRYLTKPTNPKEVISIINSIEEELSQKMKEEDEKYDAEDSNLIICRAKDYIATNFAQKISLKSISEALYISPNYLCKLFKRSTGKHLTEYIVEYRMAKAKKNLKNLQYKVSEVAEMVGYNDTKYFSSTFKKICGLTPLEYRNSQEQ